MKNYSLFTLMMMFGLFTLNAQTTILDFETPTTTAPFEFFGSSLPAGATNITIVNPAPGGINTSAMVGEFTKPAGSQVWAGGFADVSTVMDFTNNNAICLKVWVNEPTNLLLKVENGTPSLDWELEKQIDVAQTWVEVCYNVTGQIAENQVYNRLVLFFDFGTSLAADQTYYFDDVVTTTMTPELYDVTFSVNMNTYPSAFDSVFVSGTFNGFSLNSNPLEDSDGDGIWTHTIADMAPGNYEYLFRLDKFGVEENFSDKYYDCTNTTFGANGEVFINRTLTVSADAILPTVCFNSCYDCGEAITITMHLGENNATPSPDGFFVAGGGNFSVPGVFAMTDSGNGIHTAIFEKPMGFASHYTYANGACSDFSCKEVITGQACADPTSFDDRFMGPLTQNTIITDCFELCNTAGSTCLAGLCPPNYAVANALNGMIRNYTIYTTNGNIESTQMIEWAADVEYSGGTEIMLDNGFEVGPGVEFKAVLDGCN